MDKGTIAKAGLMFVIPAGFVIVVVGSFLVESTLIVAYILGFFSSIIVDKYVREEEE